MAAVAAALTAGPIHTAATRAPATVLVGLIYPWGDLVLLALAAGMLPIRELAQRVSLGPSGRRICSVRGRGHGVSLRDLRRLVPGRHLARCLLARVVIVGGDGQLGASSSVAPLPRRGLGSYVESVACTVVALAVAVLGHDSRLATTLAALSLIAVAARFSVTFRDVSMLAESHKHAMTDELTALPNRRSLATALTALRPRSALSGPSLATGRHHVERCCCWNLYEFQEINDSVGRHFGDELLRHIANRLSSSVRREDLLARVRR